MLVLLFLNFSILKNVRYGTLAIKVYNIFYFLFPKTNSVRTWNTTEMDIFGNFEHFISSITQKSLFCGKKKNHTHVKKVGNTSEFLFGIYRWAGLEKQLLKDCWSGPIKNVRLLIFTILYIFKKK